MAERTKTNLALNIGTLAALLIALIAGGFIAADLYDIVRTVEKQSAIIGITTNHTIAQILMGQEKANQRGNSTIHYFETLLDKVINSESNIIGNLSDHRRIANMTRDTQIALLEQILNQTKTK